MSKIRIFGRMWPRYGLARLSSHFYSFQSKSSSAKFLALMFLIPLFHSCTLDSIRNSPGHRAMYYYDSIQDAAARQHLQEQGYLQEGGLNDE